MNLFDFVSSLGKSAKFAGMTYFVDADVNCPKTKNQHLDGLKKAVRCEVILNFIYENSVINQAKKDGIDLESLDFGQRKNNLCYFDGSKTLMHYNGDTERKYLWCKVQTVFEVEYSLNGIILPKEKVEPFLNKPKYSGVQEDLTKKIFGRNFKFESVVSLTCDGQTYYK
jgi:hypothetical protein